MKHELVIRRRATASQGLSLVEILVAMGILAGAVMLVLGLIPAGTMSLKQAENLQTATAYGLGLLEEAPIPPEDILPTEPEELKLTVNGTLFEATRQMVPATEDCYDVVVVVRWDDNRRPVELRLRRYRGENWL